MMKKSLIALISLSFISIVAFPQKKPSTYLDRNGVLRWTEDKAEVAEFGVHYALPFSTAYSNFNELGLDYENGIKQDVYHLARLGVKAYRIHMWDAEVTDTLGNLQNNRHLHLLDLTIKEMKDRGFKILITPLNYYATKEKEYGIGQKWGKAGSLSPEAITATKNYIGQLMNHQNPYTGKAYKDDEDIIGFEIYNEPGHQGQTEDTVVPYINDLVSAFRKAGCRKPLFWCMAMVPDLINGFVKSNVQGGSFQWYSVSHNAGFQFKGNLLTHVDQWPKDTLTDVVKKNGMALISYELDAADNGYSYTYPFMARSMREAGFQFASMFSYDPMGIAAYNTEYRTHYMNMAYTPKKAMGLKIAGEVFRTTPRGKQFGRFPQDTTFGVFHANHEHDLVEMVARDKFFYSSSTTSVPEDISELSEIAGIGSSCVVDYDGRGIYFLDKLEEGVWRLEVMPDATWVDNPFGSPELGKEMSAIVWNEYPMTVNLPDLGEGYRVKGINEGNSLETVASGKTVVISPGVYLLSRAGLSPEWKKDDIWKDIRIGEYYAPEPTGNSYMLLEPVKEFVKGRKAVIDIEVISQEIPEKVTLSLYTLAPETVKPVEFKRVSRYRYSAEIPEGIISQEDFISYRISVTSGDRTRTYPSDGSNAQTDFINTEMFSAKVVEPDAPLTLLNVASDYKEIRRNHRHYRYVFRTSDTPRLMGLELSSGSLVYASHYVVGCVRGREEDLARKKDIVIKAWTCSEKPVQAWVVLQGVNGLEYGTKFTVSKDRTVYELPLADLEQVRVTGPGEKGFVYIDPFDGERQAFDISGLETVKLAVLPKDNQNSSAVFEYIFLK